MTPRHLKFPSPFGEGLGVRLGGRGGVSVFYPHTTFHILLSLYLISLTPPLSPLTASFRTLTHQEGVIIFSSFIISRRKKQEEKQEMSNGITTDAKPRDNVNNFVEQS